MMSMRINSSAPNNNNNNVNIAASSSQSTNIFHKRLHPASSPLNTTSLADLSKNQLNMDDDEDMEPIRKQLITEERMAARLRNFHISADRPFNYASQWYCMQPTETFEQIEERLIDSDDDDEPIDDDACGSGGVGFEMSPELAGIIKQRNVTPIYIQPRMDMQVVVWTPKSDFVADIVNRSMNERIVEIDNDDDELHDESMMTMQENRTSTNTHLISYPESDDDIDDGNIGHKSNLTIVELPPSDDEMDIDG